MTEKKYKQLLKKLVSPVHVGYISRYILECDMSETMSILNELTENEIIELSEYGKGYYVLKAKKNSKING